MPNRQEDNGLRAVAIAIPFLIAVLVWVSFLSRPVLEFGPVRDIPNAAPGQTASLSARITILRTECAAVAGSSWIMFRDSRGVDFVINQHSGFIPSLDFLLPDKTASEDMVTMFEVPRFASQGPAEVQLISAWECPMAFGLINAHSHMYPLEVNHD